MFARLSPRAALMGAALATMSASALAASTVVETRYATRYEAPVRQTTTTTTTTTYIESPAYYTPPATYYVQPTTVVTVPPTTVIAPRATDDELITADVADRIISNPRINGTIGIETNRQVVTLSGRVSTPGQAREAVREAQRVDGVRDVRHDYLATRVGGSY